MHFRQDFQAQGLIVLRKVEPEVSSPHFQSQLRGQQRRRKGRLEISFRIVKNAVASPKVPSKVKVVTATIYLEYPTTSLAGTSSVAVPSRHVATRLDTLGLGALL